MDALATVGLNDLASAAAVLLAAILGVVVVQRLLGGPSLHQLGCTPLDGHRTALVLGLVLGPLVFGAVLALEAAIRVVRIAPGNLDPAILLLAALTIGAVGAGEELMMRGVLLQQVLRGWGVRTAIFVSSLVFALLHLPNLLTAAAEPVVSAMALLVLTLLGIVLGIGAVLTRGLWFPVALHVSWNLAQGPLFGFPISGHPSDGLVQIDVTGADWLTGGAFGPEGGLVGLLAVALCGAALWAYARLGVGRRSVPASIPFN
jgi:membrane protease YdiL (CAAX protease family)